MDYKYEYGLKEYVLFKYYTAMDPIDCARVNGSQYCWVKGNAGEKGTEDEFLGAYLFPVVQHYNKDCYNCSRSKDAKTAAKANDKTCNEIDLEMILYFNPKQASIPHFVRTFNASFREERRKYSMTNSGLQGALYLNFYGGVKYLNDLFYVLPNTHCDKPIPIAKGAKTKNNLACGTKYQQSLLKSKKKVTRKAAEKSYCMNTPLPPQETYFECRYADQECVARGIAEGAGQSALVATVLGIFVVMIATTCMGLPSIEAKEGKYKQPKNMMAKAVAKFKAWRLKRHNKALQAAAVADETNPDKADTAPTLTLEALAEKLCEAERQLEELSNRVPGGAAKSLAAPKNVPTKGAKFAGNKDTPGTAF